MEGDVYLRSDDDPEEEDFPGHVEHEGVDFGKLLRDIGFQSHQDVSVACPCYWIVYRVFDGQTDPITFANFADFLHFLRAREKMSTEDLQKLKEYLEKLIDEKLSRLGSVGDKEGGVDEGDSSLSKFDIKHRPRTSVQLAVRCISLRGSSKF